MRLIGIALRGLKYFVIVELSVVFLLLELLSLWGLAGVVVRVVGLSWVLFFWFAVVAVVVEW